VYDRRPESLYEELEHVSELCGPPHGFAPSTTR